MERIRETAFSFAEVTGIPVTCFDAKGECLWEYGSDIKVCSKFKIYQEQGGLCRSNLLSSSRTAAQLGEPYVFLCSAGFVKIAFSLIINKKVAGCLIAGPILVGALKENIFDNIVSLNELSIDSYSKVLMALKDMKEFKPEEVTRIASLFESCILGGITPNTDYIKVAKHHQEMQKIAENMKKYRIVTIEEQSYSGRSQIIRLAVELINEHFKDNISLSAIAERLHTNPSYLSMLFKQETGVTLTNYISQARIKKSCDLLSETTASLSDIAAQCGFPDQSYFSKVFKKVTGITPKEYRKNTF